MSGCLLNCASLSAISFGDKIKSTVPAAIAAWGMLVNSAVSSWAKVKPPWCLMSSIPTIPSLALPLRMIPITRSFCAWASDEKRTLMETAELFSARGINFMCPSVTSIPLLCGITKI